MSALSLLVVGSVNVDLLLQVPRHPQPGETVLAEGGLQFPGGKGANQAVAAARLGCDVTFVGAVGDDLNASLGLSLLAQAGVHLGHVSHVPGPTGLAVIALDPQGENSIIVLPGANAHLELSAEARGAISVAPIVLVQGEVPETTLTELSSLVRGRLILNLAPFLQLPLDSLRQANPLIVNEHEARLVDLHLGAEPTEVITPEETAARLLGHGIPSIVITLGGQGVLVADASGITLIPALAVPIIDTTGAGDAFCGAFAACLAGGGSLRNAAELANRAAAFSVQRLGAQSSYAWSADLES